MAVIRVVQAAFAGLPALPCSGPSSDSRGMTRLGTLAAILAAGAALDPVNGQIFVANSQVTSAGAGSGSPTCVGAFDGSYAALDAT